MKMKHLECPKVKATTMKARRASVASFTVISVLSTLILILAIGINSGAVSASPASTAAPPPKTHNKHGHHHQHHPHHQDWDRTEIMDANGLYILEWNVVDAKEIVFKITVNTGGFIGLGFSYKTGRMANSDLVLAWVDDHTGEPNVLVSLQSAHCLLSASLCPKELQTFAENCWAEMS